jgi:flagellin
MLSIRSNAASTSAQNNMSNVSNSLQKSMERLSSGYRINRAGDDAAGLAISEKLKAQVGGLMQAARNSGDGISMIQTAEGGMDEIQNMLQRMRELAVEASNDTLGTSERVNIGQELDALRNEADSVANRTKFNGLGLLAGSLATKQGASTNVLTGANALTAGSGTGAGQGATISAIDVSGAVGGTNFTFSGSGTNLTLTNASTHQAYTIDLSTSAGFGAATLAATKDATLDFQSLGVKVTIHAGTATESASGLVTDLAASAQNQISTATGSGAAQLQSGANAGDTTSISFADVRLNGGANTNMQAVWTQVTNFLNTSDATNYASQAGASTLISNLDGALNTLSTERAKLGAAQNRLEHSISSVKSQSANLDASNSRIRDVDVAEESGAMARANVLMQAGVSVLAQANQMPQLALKLLG